jgi:hypothetical protein
LRYANRAQRGASQYGALQKFPSRQAHYTTSELQSVVGRLTLF